MKRIKLTLLVAAVAASPVYAEGLQVEPGLWEMTSTVNMPMLPQPQVNTVSECINKSEISMDELSGDDLQGDCSFETVELEGNSIQWVVDCQVEGGSSRGEWVVTSYGESLVGEGGMTMNISGQEMTMDMSWSGQRIGPCSDAQ